MSEQIWLALDLGGVLFDVDISQYVSKATQAFSVTKHELSAATFESGHWLAAETGQLNAENFARAVLTAMHVSPTRTSCQRWQQCWSSVLTLRPGVMALLTKIRHPIAIWSNTDPVHAMQLRKELKNLDAMWLLSCELGVEKPAPDFYLQSLNNMQSQAALVHYFDDRQDNVNAAAQLGIQAHQVQSFDVLKQQLQINGLLRH